MTPGGRSVCAISSQNLTALCGVSSLGLMTMVLPVTSAGAALRAIRKNGKVPGKNAADHADGLAEEQDGLAGAVAFQNLALDAAGPFGHVVEVIGGEGDFDARQAEDLALLLGDDARERLDVLADLRGDGAEGPGALDGGALRPSLLRGLGGGDGGFDIGRGAVGNGTDGLAGGRIETRDAIRAGGGREFAVDEVIVVLHRRNHLAATRAERVESTLAS